MNLKEVLVAESMADLLNTKDVVIVDVKPILQTKSDLIILKALADINKMRGIVITLERPHHYLTYLLGIQGVNQRNITYIDLAYSKKKKVKFPLKITKENSKILGGFIKEDIVDLKNFDFLMVDNISTAKMFLSKDSIINFVHYLIKEARKHKATIILPMDFSREEELLNSIKKYPHMEINFEEVMKNAY